MSTGIPEKQRRFRRRGGAKKKKKNIASGELNAGESSKEYFSGFTPAPDIDTPASQPAVVSGSSYLYASIDGDLENYLTQLGEQFDLLTSSGQPDEEYSNPDDINGANPSPASLLSRNALKHLSPRLYELARHNLASRLLERLIPFAGATNSVNALNTLLEAGDRQFSSLAVHPCASHLLQALLDSAFSAGVPPLICDVIKSWDYDTLVQMISSTAGTHVFRSILALLSGVSVEEPARARLLDAGPPLLQPYDGIAMERDELSKAAVVSLAKNVMEHPERLLDLIFVPHSSAALQALLTALAVCDPPIGASLAEAVLSTSKFDEIVTHRCASRFVDRAILTCGAHIIKPFTKDDTLILYARHPSANFCVQRYISALTKRGEVMRIARVLEPMVAQHLLAFGTAREGVVLAVLHALEHFGESNSRALLARAVAKGVGAVGASARHLAGFLTLRQQAVWQEWCRRVDEFGINGLVAGEMPDGKTLRLPHSLPRPSLLGTLVAGTLMRFPGGAGQSARDSMASISNVQLLALSADATGSRLVEGWLNNPAAKMSEKISGKLITLYMGDGTVDGFFGAVCRNPYAGILLVRCVERTNVDMRRKVMEALAGLEEELSNDRFGFVVIRKCRVRQFMQRNGQWEKEETVRERKQRLFSDVLEEEDGETEFKSAPKSSDKKKKKKRKLVHSAEQRSGVKEQQRSENLDGSTDVIGGGDDGDDINLTAVISAIEATKSKKKKKKEKI